jgi:hypothetical protein
LICEGTTIGKAHQCEQVAKETDDRVIGAQTLALAQQGMRWRPTQLSFCDRIPTWGESINRKLVLEKAVTSIVPTAEPDLLPYFHKTLAPDYDIAFSKHVGVC